MKFKEIEASKISVAKRSLIFGVGINDASYITGRYVNGVYKQCPFYVRWTSMIQRCYSKIRLRRYPTYIGCEVCQEWLTFSNFKSWMERHAWKLKHLDKDFIKLGNKIYSPDFCMFISPYINSLMCDNRESRGGKPKGVTKRGSRFQANIRKYGKAVVLGTFATMDMAEDAYLAARSDHFLDVAANLGSGEDPRLKLALINAATTIQQ